MAISFKYYRLVITNFARNSATLQTYANIGEFALYDENNVNIARETGATYTADCYQSDSPPANAFDGSVTTHWHSAWQTHINTSHWLQVQLASAKAITKFSLTPHNANNANLDVPISFKLQGSVDGNIFTDIYTATDLTTGWSQATERFFDNLNNNIAIIQSECYETSRGTTLSGTVTCQANDFVLATITVRSTLTLDSNLILLNTSDAIVDGTNNQTLTFAYKKITTDGTYTYTVTQAASERIYLNLIVIRGIARITYSGDYYNFSETEISSSNQITPASKSANSMLIWGCSAYLWSTGSPYGSWTCTPNDLTQLELNQATTQPRQANFVDFGNGATSHNFYPVSSSKCIIDAVELFDHETKYLIKSGNTYYNFVDNELNELSITSLTAANFEAYGNNTIAASELLITLASPTIYSWTDVEIVKTLTASVTATPTAQAITSNNFVFDDTITGISTIVIDADDNTIFNFSSDDGATWQAYDTVQEIWQTVISGGMSKTEVSLLTVSEWSALLGTAEQIKVKFILSDSTSYVKSIVINYANTSY